MMRPIKTSSMWDALCATLAIGLAVTARAQSITFIGSTTGSDYSDTGLDLGNLGFWFANFAATTPVDGAAIDSNDRNLLPSWVSLDPTPDATFAGTATTSGGHAGWAALTLPDGENGLSGAVVDSNTNNNPNNTIRRLQLGPGAPSAFFFHIVTDNTIGKHDPAGRLRARAEDPGLFDVSAVNMPPGLAANMDGLPDVYTWLYEGMSDSTFIKLQLDSGDPFVAASVAGVMFDAVPEPSAILLFLSGMAWACWRFRSRKRSKTATLRRVVPTMSVLVLMLYASSIARAVTYQIDDGEAELFLGAPPRDPLAPPTAIAWLNSFQVQPGAETLTSIDMPLPAIGIFVSPVTVYLWTDPTNDGDPTDAVVARSMPTFTGSSDFVNIPIDPLTLPTGDWFFAGAIYERPLAFAADVVAIDTTDPVLVSRSFLATWLDSALADPNDLSAGALFFGPEPLNGNYLIRVNAVPEPGTGSLAVIASCAIVFLLNQRRRSGSNERLGWNSG